PATSAAVLSIGASVSRSSTELAIAHTASQTSTTQRVPRESRGMTTGTSAPSSPPRSSAATSPQPASASLIELMPAPRSCRTEICSDIAALPLLVGGFPRLGLHGDRAADLLHPLGTRDRLVLGGDDLDLRLLRRLQQLLDPVLSAADPRCDLLAARR